MKAMSFSFCASSFKPIPDEEGTETRAYLSLSVGMPWRFKPIPDEEGTETRCGRRRSEAPCRRLQTDPR